jgi:serine/threonine protein kinase
VAETVVPATSSAPDSGAASTAGPVPVADATIAASRTPVGDETVASGRLAAMPYRAPDEEHPKRIAQYVITRIVASGGMGTVYLAEQDHPKRTVALKVMKPGIVSPDTLRRFEYEVEILGRLRHPNIAQVYEAGTHDDGRGGMPYFVMEYVPSALTLTRYAESEHLSMRRRLEMFIDICEAVHHGHQKGVIHRDLKPGNILIDPSGAPKIIDFGVARATDSDMAGATMQTEVGQLVGTVQYMSPEQVEADPSKIDTRSDVYALGVVLHEFLTGKLPYDLRDLPIYEATRIIREEDVKRIGTAHPEMKGDIETIILHALEKEPERRYQSAAELSNDIRRMLNDEPISARPPSTVYAFSKFYRRNRGFVSALAAGLVVLVMGFIGTAWGWRSASTSRDDAIAKNQTAQATVGFFLHDVVTSADPRDGKGLLYTIGEMLDDIGRNVHTKLADQPEAEATIRSALGLAWKEHSKFEAAEAELREAIRLFRTANSNAGPHEGLARALHDLGGVLWFRGQFDEARNVLEESLAMRRALYDGAHEEVANTLDYIAACHERMRDTQRAQKIYAEALAMRRAYWGEDNEYVARTLNNLAMSMLRAGNAVEAEPLLRRATDIVRDVRGDKHVDVASGLSNHASALIDLGQYDEAESTLLEALAIKRVHYGPDHDRVASTLTHLASLCKRLNRLDEAEGYQKEALAILETSLGKSLHRRVVQAIDAMNELEEAQGDWPAVETLMLDLAARRRSLDFQNTAPIALAERNAAVAQIRQQRYTDAAALLEQCWPVIDDFGPNHAERQETIRVFVELSEATGNTASAAQWRQRLVTSTADDAPAAAISPAVSE